MQWQRASDVRGQRNCNIFDYKRLPDIRCRRFYFKNEDFDCGSIFTVRDSSCGKVMFSQACVKNSVHRGGGGVAGETATAADGTHPIGMHSCCELFKGYRKHVLVYP